MTDAKIEIKVGEIHFSGEGNQEWVGKQLDKILEKAEELLKLTPPPVTQQDTNSSHNR